VSFVVDNSVAMSWCFADEATEYTESVLDQLRDSSAVVPVIWPLEVSNVLLLAERRRRITRAKATRFVRVLQELPISVETETISVALGPVLQLGRDYDLTSYDAAYLELAMRRGLSLATLDDHLANAARQADVTLVE
jgi:predicted nucleic acid-binding protein